MEIAGSESKEKTEESKPLLETPVAEEHGLSKEEKIQKKYLELCRKYSENGSCRTQIVQCLECGYKGEMPVAGNKTLSGMEQLGYVVGWGIAVIWLLFGVPFFIILMIAGAVVRYVKGDFDKVYVVCPSCEKRLGPV
jgi:hypothetical protein